MSTRERRPVVDFDHNSTEHAADPAASYRRLRTTHPVAWTEVHGGYWVISDYAGVFAAARDDDLFSSQRSSHGGEGSNVLIPKTPTHVRIPIEVDPPDFRAYRKMINTITAPAAIEAMTDMVHFYTTWFIDRVIESGECDFAEVIGVPAIVTIDWLGLPVNEWARYTATHRALLTADLGGERFRQAVEEDLPYLSAQMLDTIRARRAQSADDVISYLVAQEFNGEPLDDDTVFAMVDLLISGGTGTTASLVGQTLVWLYQHPETRDRLVRDPSLLERAVEEFLRYFSPTQALARTVTRDQEFRGCPMHQGDRVLLSWASANRDAEAEFTDPDEVDIERWPNRHAAFGVGIHRCAGSHLGRAMARSLIGQVLQRMPDYVIDTERLTRYERQGVNSGYSTIPATFTPGPRRLSSTEPSFRGSGYRAT